MASPPVRARSGFLPVALVVGALALAARSWSRAHLGVLTTLDSFDYLTLSGGIAAGDWSSPRLGGVRLPGYPLVLAALRWTTDLDAGTLLAAQQLLGVAAALGFAWSSWRLLGRGAGLAVGALAALHPALLLLEHTAMSETLFVATLAATLAAATAAAAPQRPGRAGLLLGSSAASTLLVRANGILLVASLLLSAIRWAWRRSPAPVGGRRCRRPAIRFAAWTFAGLGILLVPWLARQQALFGHPSLTDYDETILVYLAQHRLVDPSLPGFARLRDFYDPAHPETVYGVVQRLVAVGYRSRKPRIDPHAVLFRSSFESGGVADWDGVEAVAAAARGRELPALSTKPLIAEQLRDRGAALRQARWRSFLAFAGFPPTGPDAPWGQDDLRRWLGGSGEGTGRPPAPAVDARDLPSVAELPGAGEVVAGAGLEAWRTALELCLDGLRPALSLALGALLVYRLLPGARRRAHPALAPLALGWLATALLHGWILAGYERFAVPFDPVLLLSVLLALRSGTPDGDAGGLRSP